MDLFSWYLPVLQFGVDRMGLESRGGPGADILFPKNLLRFRGQFYQFDLLPEKYSIFIRQNFL